MLIGALAMPGGAAQAAETADCSGPRDPLPASLAGWNERSPLADGAVLSEGRAADIALKSVADVRFAAAPERPAPEGSFGATLPISVKSAGNYRVALGAGGWIDVVQGGKLIVSTAHGHGPACSGVRKMVDFALAPGDYVIQISGVKAASVALLFAPLR